MDFKTLSSGKKIQQIAYGTYLSHNKDCYEGVRHALDVGYTHIDTAAFYLNEKFVGKAIKKSGKNREEVFVTTKIWNDMQGTVKSKLSIELSLKNLDLDYIDCMLIHWPIPTGRQHDYQYLNAQTFEVMEKYRQKGLIKHIGVSNFLPSHIDQLYANTSLMPCINQIEMHAGLKQEEIVSYCNEKNILVSAWRPLVKGTCVNDKTLLEIASAVNKTPAQVALRYVIQKGCIPIPKSITKSRIEENFDVFSFSLTNEQMQLIDDMKENRVGTHPLKMNK